MTDGGPGGVNWRKPFAGGWWLGAGRRGAVTGQGAGLPGKREGGWGCGMEGEGRRVQSAQLGRRV